PSSPVAAFASERSTEATVTVTFFAGWPLRVTFPVRTLLPFDSDEHPIARSPTNRSEQRIGNRITGCVLTWCLVPVGREYLPIVGHDREPERQDVGALVHPANTAVGHPELHGQGVRRVRAPARAVGAPHSRLDAPLVVPPVRGGPVRRVGRLVHPER